MLLAIVGTMLATWYRMHASQTAAANDTTKTGRDSEAERLAAVKAGHWTGAKYQFGRTPAQIAALVRADLKVASKTAGVLKGCKFSVRSSWSGHTPSLTITVTPPAGVVVSIPRIRAEIERPEEHHATHRASEAWRAIEAAVECAANVYGFDKSDLCTDYHHSAFFLDVKADNNMVVEQREVFEAALLYMISTVQEPFEKGSRR